MYVAILLFSPHNNAIKEQALANLPTFATEHLVGSITEEDTTTLKERPDIGKRNIVLKEEFDSLTRIAAQGQTIR